MKAASSCVSHSLGTSEPSCLSISATCLASSFTYRLGDLRYAVGPGLRYNTPVGPLRLDVGVIVDRRPGEDFGRIEFSIGQAF